MESLKTDPYFSDLSFEDVLKKRVSCVDKNFFLKPALFLNEDVIVWLQSLGGSTVQGIETTITFRLEYHTLFTRSSPCALRAAFLSP